MTVNNAVPFMAKGKIEKRKFIEDIFGMEVFSQMLAQLRVEYNELKREHDIVQTTLTEVKNPLVITGVMTAPTPLPIINKFGGEAYDSPTL